MVGVRAGSVTYPGAGVLCVAGAASGLCGMVRYVAGARDEVIAAHPDVVVENGRVQAWTIGSGGGPDVATMLAEARRTACRSWSTPTRWRWSTAR